MKILVVAAHPDDEILGPGGTLAKHASNGDEVYACILCEQVKARKEKPEHGKFLEQIEASAKLVGIKDTMFFDFPNIKMNTSAMLDIVQSIEKAIIKFKPEIVYTHHHGDVNDDHKIVFEATMAAIRLPERGTADLPRNMIKKVLCYETLSSTEWAASLPEFAFLPNYFVDIKDFLDKKIEALRCYENVIREHPHPRSEEAIKMHAKLRGVQTGLEAAEAFVLVRELE